MKTSTCQLVLGGVITGDVHYIGSINPLWPLCGRHKIRVCQRLSAKFLPTQLAASCQYCRQETQRQPIIYDHTFETVANDSVVFT